MVATISYDLDILDRNISRIREIENQVRQGGGNLTVLYALKASYATLPYFSSLGITGEVSSAGEALLSAAHLPGKSHAFCVSITEDEWREISPLISHLSFNSLTQGGRFASRSESLGISCGLRINPRHSVSTYPEYDPCRAGCRFGLDIGELPNPPPQWVSGLHFHALSENSAEDFVRVLDAFEAGVSHILPSLSWVNLGGGHLCTSESYRRDILVAAIQRFSLRHPHLAIYLEPGAAWVWEAGTLEVEITDIVERSGVKTAVLDFSIRAHASDFLIGGQMTGLPFDVEGFTPVEESDINEEDLPERNTYHFGGSSCATCDTKGPYRTEQELRIGDTLRLRNMGHYVDVTFSWFNGTVPPSIAYQRGAMREMVVVRDAQGFRGAIGM